VPIDDDIEAYWAEVQRAVDQHLYSSGLEHLEPMGREYVQALRMGRELREAADKNPFTELASGRIVANPLFESADRFIRGGVQLAKTLGLCKPGAAAAGEDPFAELDEELPVATSLSARRRARERTQSA
jgi:hypothetical protein